MITEKIKQGDSVFVFFDHDNWKYLKKKERKPRIIKFKVVKITPNGDKMLMKIEAKKKYFDESHSIGGSAITICDSDYHYWGKNEMKVLREKKSLRKDFAIMKSFKKKRFMKALKDYLK